MSENLDLLTTCGTFNTNDCTSSEELCKLLDKPIDWVQWITLQIEQDSVDNYISWYENMLKRGAACDELIEAHNKLFGEKE